MTARHQGCNPASVHTFSSARIEDFDKPFHARTRSSASGKRRVNEGGERQGRSGSARRRRRQAHDPPAQRGVLQVHLEADRRVSGLQGRVCTSSMPARDEAGRNRPAHERWPERTKIDYERTRHGTAAVTKQAPQRDRKRTATTERPDASALRTAVDDGPGFRGVLAPDGGLYSILRSFGMILSSDLRWALN